MTCAARLQKCHDEALVVTVWQISLSSSMSKHCFLMCIGLNLVSMRWLSSTPYENDLIKNNEPAVHKNAYRDKPQFRSFGRSLDITYKIRPFYLYVALFRASPEHALFLDGRLSILNEFSVTFSLSVVSWGSHRLVQIYGRFWRLADHQNKISRACLRSHMLTASGPQCLWFLTKFAASRSRTAEWTLMRIPSLTGTGSCKLVAAEEVLH